MPTAVPGSTSRVRIATNWRMQINSRPGRWTPIALSLLRIFVGLTFVQHGTHKCFNFPSGQSYEGINLATLHGWAGVIELVAGALILLGLFTRFAAFIASGEMAVGYFVVHASASFFTAKNGGENAYLFCFIFLFFVFAGPGPISLDYLIFGRRKSIDPGEATPVTP